MRKRFALGMLVLVVFAGMAVAEEVTGTIIFEPERSPGSYKYSIATGENSRVADKMMFTDYGTVGSALSVLPNYLVKGAKIVYENEGMRNTRDETIHPGRLIAIIMEDGYYMELTEILSIFNIANNFNYLYQKLKREGRLPQ
jgi:hypothetical protein